MRSVCIMMYTSGTTDLPKGCPLTHEALVRSGRAMSRQRFLLTAEDVFWDPLPMFHMSAILPITAVFDAGATFLSMTHVEPDAAINQDRERATDGVVSFLPDADHCADTRFEMGRSRPDTSQSG